MTAGDLVDGCNLRPGRVRHRAMDADGSPRRARWAFTTSGLRHGTAVTAVAVLLISLSACIRRPPASEGSQDYAITVTLQAPPRERPTADSCEIASRAAGDDPFAVDTVLLLDRASGLGRYQAAMVPGVLDDEQRCRVTLLFDFVHPDADGYVLRTRYGTGWRMTSDEAFAHPVIDVVQRAPGDV